MLRISRMGIAFLSPPSICMLKYKLRASVDMSAPASSTEGHVCTAAQAWLTREPAPPQLLSDSTSDGCALYQPRTYCVKQI